MSAPAYHLPPRPAKRPSWLMGDLEAWTERQNALRFVTRAVDEIQVEDGHTLEGRMVPYDEFAEIKSPREGHFLERFAFGSLRGEIEHGIGRLKVLFEHGEDPRLGRQQIARLTWLREQPDGAYFRAQLLKGVPPLIVSGLKAGVYGSSIRFGPIDSQTVQFPGRSASNPEGLPEKTILEARVREFSVVTFPAYKGATALVR